MTNGESTHDGLSDAELAERALSDKRVIKLTQTMIAHRAEVVDDPSFDTEGVAWQYGMASEELNGVVEQAVSTRIGR